MGTTAKGLTSANEGLYHVTEAAGQDTISQSLNLIEYGLVVRMIGFRAEPSLGKESALEPLFRAYILPGVIWIKGAV